MSVYYMSNTTIDVADQSLLIVLCNLVLLYIFKHKASLPES